MLGRSCFAFALSPQGCWDWPEQAGPWPHSVLSRNVRAAPRSHPWPLPDPAPFSSQHRMRGEQKTGTNTWQYCLSTLSWLSGLCHSGIFSLVKQDIFGYLRQEPAQRALCPACYFPSWQPWLQANSKASQRTSPKSTLGPSQRLLSVCQAASHSLSMALHTQPLGSRGSGHTVTTQDALQPLKLWLTHGTHLS